MHAFEEIMIRSLTIILVQLSSFEFSSSFLKGMNDTMLCCVGIYVAYLLDMHFFALSNCCYFVEVNLSNLSITKINLWVKVIDFERLAHELW
jgi:hypothetical protein